MRARTTPEMRAYIKASDKSVRELAAELGVSQTTIRRWRARTTVDGVWLAPKRRRAEPLAVRADGHLSRGLVADDHCATLEPTECNSLLETNTPPAPHVGVSVVAYQGGSGPRSISSSLGRYALALCLLGAVVYGASAQTLVRAVDVFSQKGETVVVSAKKRIAAKRAVPRTNETTGRAGLASAPAVSIASLDAANANAPAPAPAKIEAAAGSGGEWVEISASGVNMRAGPSPATNVVTVQSLGIKLRVLSRESRWTEVIDPETGQRGWVFHRYTKPSGPPSNAQRTEPSTTGVTQQQTLF